MKIVLFFVLLTSSIMAFEHKFELGINGISYSKYTDEFVTSGSADIAFQNKIFNTNARVEFLYSSEYKDRKYFLLNELYITKEFNDYTFSIGKKIKYWGELEGYNLADIYNQKNYLKDPFDKGAKYGSIGADITRYFDENSLEVGVKLYEEDVEYPKNDTPYTLLPLDYDKKLQLSDKRYTPSFYMLANIVTDETIDSETKIILFHGYDIKRNIIPISATTLSQYDYRVNKMILLSHIIYLDTIFKTEIAYTDVIDYGLISDYMQLSFGAEKSFYEIAGSDVTLFAEYYNYIYYDNTKTKNIDISEIYDDDIFLALKVNFNDTGSSELKLGILKDIKKNERVIKLEANSRIMDSFILSGKYLKIVSNTANTILTRFGNSSRFIVEMRYVF